MMTMIKRRTFVRACLGAGALLTRPGQAALRPDLHWQSRALVGFGTTLSFQAAHENEALLTRALDAAVAAQRRIETQMSLFDAYSALSRLNRDGVLDAPPSELLEILQLSRAVSARSGGAFDVTVQPLWAAYATAQAQGRLPTPSEVAAARGRVDWRALEVAPRRLRFRGAGMGATLNGIAQGYAADRVRRVLAAHGIRHALIDAGEYSTLGHNAHDQPWALAVADPRHEAAYVARLLADGRCLATSADDQTSFSADHRYHHIFDPHTGYSPPELAGVTVAAPSGALADALTKVMFVAGVEGSLRLAKVWGVDVLLIDKAGRVRATAGMPIAKG
ncbi:MAG TPA: FAD:protein FMN transferase [Methylibium sp.]